MRTKSLVILAVSLVVALAIGFILGGCGRLVRGGVSGDRAYLGTQSPGDAWSWIIGDNTFIGTNEATNAWYSGTYTSLPSGFLRATVSNSSDGGAIGGVAYVVEFPNTLLLVKPLDGNVIVCAAKGTTAPSAGDYPWISVPDQNWDPTSSTSYGKTIVTESGGSYDFEVDTYTIGDTLLGTQIDTGYSFADGKLTKAGSSLEVFMTPSGAFIFDNGPNEGGGGGAAKFTFSTTEAVSHSYRGFTFRYDPNTGEGTTEAIGADPNTGEPGKLLGFSFADVDADQKNLTQAGTIEFGGQMTSGVVPATMVNPSGTEQFRMVISQVNNKYIIFGVSARGNEASNFLVVQSD